MTDLESPIPWETEFGFVLWRAQLAVHKLAQVSLAQLGVTVTQLGLAVHLHDLGHLSASDLARSHHITPQSVGTALKHLEKIGWVSRRPHPVHGRVILFQLTETGEAGVLEGRELITAENDLVTSTLTPDETRMVVDALSRVVVALEGESRPPEALWPVIQGRRT